MTYDIFKLTSETPDTAAEYLSKPTAVFWRRVLAFVIDCFVLGIAGFGLGLIFFDSFARLGVWGKLIGFLISLAYFGVLNSSIGEGQTLGKRLTNIKVVNGAGKLISPARSFLRYTILAAPFFLNGALIPPSSFSTILTVAFGLIIFGLGGAIIYLFIFNRRTRQSVHDLALDTFVVANASDESTPFGVIWKYHLLIIGVWAFVLLAGSLIAATFISQNTALIDLFQVQSRIQDTGKVNTSTVFVGTAWGPAGTTNYLTVNAFWKDNPISGESEASEIAAIVLSEYPDAINKDVLAVTITYGFDIGIASGWTGYNEYHSPAEWKEKIP